MLPKRKLKISFFHIALVGFALSLSFVGLSQALAQKDGPQALMRDETLDEPAFNYVDGIDDSEADIIEIPYTEDTEEYVDPNIEQEPDRYGGNFENEITIKTIDGRRFNFTVELAITPSTQEKGLMFRKSMPDNHGMLFVFGSDFQRSFWMKNTLIPLDIIFVESDGRIQHIHSNAKPLDEAFITSGLPSLAVLELNGGTANELGINSGDYIFHTAFRNRNRE